MDVIKISRDIQFTGNSYVKVDIVCTKTKMKLSISTNVGTRHVLNAPMKKRLSSAEEIKEMATELLEIITKSVEEVRQLSTVKAAKQIASTNHETLATVMAVGFQEVLKPVLQEKFVKSALRSVNRSSALST